MEQYWIRYHVIMSLVALLQCSMIMCCVGWMKAAKTSSAPACMFGLLWNGPVLWTSSTVWLLTASLASDMKPIRLFHTRLTSFSSCCSFSEHTAVALMPSSTRLVTRYTSTTPVRENTQAHTSLKPVAFPVFDSFSGRHNVFSPSLWCLRLAAH